MTQTYAQIKSAIARLEKEAAALREAETARTIAQIKESIATFGLTVEQLFGRGAKALKSAVGKTLGSGKATRRGAGIPKYRHPKTGKTWTGFGKAPGWIATARNRDRFLIDQAVVVAPDSENAAVAPVAAAAKKAARKARTVAAPAKKAVRAKKAVVAAVPTPEVEVKASAAGKAARKKSAPSKKSVSAKRSVAAPKAVNIAVATKATAKTAPKAALIEAAADIVK